MAAPMLVMSQINRLKSRFGEKAFDDEFVKLATRELMAMVDANVIRSIDLWIGNRPHNRPPLLADFREARLAEAKVKFEYSARESMRAFESRRLGKSAIEMLKPLVGRVSSVAEAVEVRRLQIQAEMAKNPDYDPMCDEKWMGEYAWKPKPELDYIPRVRRKESEE